MTFSIVNKPYPSHQYMFITENYSKFTIISVWDPAPNSPAENGIPKKSLDTSLDCSMIFTRGRKYSVKPGNKKRVINYANALVHLDKLNTLSILI